MSDSVTIDRAGRIVVPAPVRRALALTAGTELELEVEGDTILLRPKSGAKIEARGRLLIVTSPMTGAAPDHRDLREERIEKQSGGNE